MNINNIELRHLRYFVAVAEELNFSRAAERLHISQPPLSQQIQDLEARIETKLFMRTKRKVELTPAGHHLMGKAVDILKRTEDALYTTRAVGRGVGEELRIGTIYSAPFVPAFGETIRAFKARNPSIRLTFREMKHAQLFQAIHAGEIDIAFVWHIASLTDKRLQFAIISNDTMSFYVSNTHPLAKTKRLSISQLAEDTLFLTSLQTKMDFLSRLESLAHQKNISLRISEEALHFSIIANLISTGCGIGILPDYIAELATGKLVPLKMDKLVPQDMKMPLAVLYRKDSANRLVADLLS